MISKKEKENGVVGGGGVFVNLVVSCHPNGTKPFCQSSDGLSVSVLLYAVIQDQCDAFQCIITSCWSLFFTLMGHNDPELIILSFTHLLKYIACLLLCSLSVASGNDNFTAATCLYCSCFTDWRLIVDDAHWICIIQRGVEILFPLYLVEEEKKSQNGGACGGHNRQCKESRVWIWNNSCLKQSWMECREWQSSAFTTW